MLFAIVLDFGYTRDPTIPSTIHDLGEHVLTYEAQTRGSIILAQSATYAHLCRQRPDLVRTGRIREIRIGQSSAKNGGGIQGGGTYHVLREARRMILRHNYTLGEKPMLVTLVAHRLHMPRALRQARLLGMSPIAAAYLPTKLYREAEQWWCRSAFLWYLGECVRYFPLKLAKQI